MRWPGAFGRWILVALAVGTVSAVVPAVAEAQRAEESRLLRQAAAQESRGELVEATATLRTLLERNPASSGGLFALERVLRAQGQVAEVLPATDAFLGRSPDASGVRYMKLRVLAEVDSTDALEEEALAWFALDPDDPTPYREVAGLYERALGVEATMELLRRGREAVGDPASLSLEMGDLHARQGARDGALEEWSRALAADPGRSGAVADRLEELPDAEEATRDLLAMLEDRDHPDVQRAAALVAVTLGLEEEGTQAARRAADRLDERQRVAFLSDLARRAENASMDDLAAWSWEELGADARSPGERRQFDQRLVEASLASGDTATALEAQERVVGSFSPGSADRRQATARLLRLEATRASPERLRELFHAFRRAFPDAPETDELAAEVSVRFLEAGDVAGAAQVLEGIDGPRSNLERGYILMARGEVPLGRQALLMAVDGLTPVEATRVIQLAGLLGRVSPAGVQRLSSAAVQAHRRDATRAGMELARGLEDLPSEDRAPLLAQAARFADQDGGVEEARELRRQLLADHSESLQAAEAALELARSLARDSAGRAEARAVLEELITTRPEAAVVPAARRELERLRGSG